MWTRVERLALKQSPWVARCRPGQLRQGWAGGTPVVRNADKQPPCKPLSRGRVLTRLSLHGSVGARRGQHLRMMGTPSQQAQAGWAPALAFRGACLLAFPHTPGRRQPCRLRWAH